MGVKLMNELDYVYPDDYIYIHSCSYFGVKNKHLVFNCSCMRKRYVIFMKNLMGNQRNVTMVAYVKSKLVVCIYPSVQDTTYKKLYLTSVT